ncbi:tyrosine phosphatase family protein [Aspergillus stella-maris]|uniref:tyrosine phosphatase family protein n=1 Tax=Aspergillus stella-maris TaxID=1810926 RepID=UPI003CCC9819
MTYPLLKKITNGANDSHQGESGRSDVLHIVSSLTGFHDAVSKQGVRVSSIESVESDGAKSELPENFGEVVKGVYRSAFPQTWNFSALKSLGLRTIITLVDEPLSQGFQSFISQNGIKHHIVPFIANKDPAVKTPACVVNLILRLMLNKSNHPMLIHCNKGKHRSGCVVACFRKLQGWDRQKIIEEYVRFSRPKQRVLDEVFIQEFDPSELSSLAQLSGARLWTASETHVNAQHEEQNSAKSILQIPYNGMRVKVSS